MDTPAASQQVSLEPYDSRRLASLCGRLDEHIKQIADRLQVDIRNRGNLFHLSGDSRAVEAASTVLNDLYAQTAETEDLTPEIVHLHLQQSNVADQADTARADNTVPFPSDDMLIRTKRVRIKPRGTHQREYVKQIRKHDINFGVGPAGTGKRAAAREAAWQMMDPHGHHGRTGTALDLAEVAAARPRTGPLYPPDAAAAPTPPPSLLPSSALSAPSSHFSPLSSFLPAAL